MSGGDGSTLSLCPRDNHPDDISFMSQFWSFLYPIYIQSTLPSRIVMTHRKTVNSNY